MRGRAIRRIAGRAILSLIVLVAVGLLTYIFLAHPSVIKWGATDEEVGQTLPGDELIPEVQKETNHAVTISAPVEEVWPWLVQIGARRGGFYSYEWLENYLLFCPIENANSIVPEWQNLRVGDEVRLCPGDFGPPPYTVADVEPERAVILGHPQEDGATSSEGAWNDIWAFVLQPTNEGNTRMILRSRVRSPTAFDQFLEPGVFFMERGMLLGIKERAERAPAGRSSAEILSFTFLGIAGLGIVGVLLSRKWPWTLAVACGGVLLLTLVLFIEHPSPVPGALLDLVILGALVWAYWPRRRRTAGRQRVA